VSGFGRTLVYGAVASAALPLAVLALGPTLGLDRALGLYAVLATAGYLAALSRGARQRVAVSCGALAAGLLAFAASGSSAELFALLGVGVALARGGLLVRRSAPRAVAIEGAVLAASLLAARWLASPGLLGSAVALWGWFVVQSFAFLPAGVRAGRAGTDGDPFEVARRHLEELLGR
jgi:hypothetical protein